MALINFYKDYDIWVLGNNRLAAKTCQAEWIGVKEFVSIYLLEGHELLEAGKPSDFCDITGTAYTNGAAFENATDEFFAGVLVPTIQGTVSLGSLPDVQNTTVTPLLANATFTGEWVDASVFGTVTVSVKSDVGSAVDGLKIEYSCDKANVIQDDHYTIFAGLGKVFTQTPTNRYYRVKYTNGAINQTSFCLESICRTAAIKNSSHRISDSIVGDDDVELVKSVISGLRDDQTFGNAILDNENRVQVSSQPYLYGIAEQSISGHTALLKFGTRSAILANTQSTIWEGTAALYQYLTVAETLSVVSSQAADAALGTGVRTMTLYGEDINFNEISEVITMTGVTPVVTTRSFFRIFRAISSTCGTSRTNVGNITITSSVSALQLVYIPAGDGQTLMTLWTVPLGKVAYITQITASNDSGKGARFSLYTRQMDGGILYPWVIKYRAYLTGGNNVVPFNIPFKITEKTDIEIRFTTDTNAGTTRGGATFELWYENI